jgi:hypothetical protein
MEFASVNQWVLSDVEFNFSFRTALGSLSLGRVVGSGLRLRRSARGDRDRQF